MVASARSGDTVPRLRIAGDSPGLHSLSKDLNDRVVTCAHGWGVTIERTVATETSLIVHGNRAGTPVVLKVVKEGNDEWRCGEIAAKFGGRGVVKVYEHMPGAAL